MSALSYLTLLHGTANNVAADNDSEGEENDLFDYFDPRLSPHLYPGGIPIPASSGSKGKNSENSASSMNGMSNGGAAIRESVESFTIRQQEQRTNSIEKVGILLIDHGSKRESSNLHLESVAMAYERSSRCPPHYVVRAAHMEIASPGIEEGLRNLIAEGACKLTNSVDCVIKFVSSC